MLSSALLALSLTVPGPLEAAPSGAGPTLPSLLAEPLTLSAAPAPRDEDGVWDFSYTYIELGATRFDLEDLDDEADNYYGEASLGLFE